MIYWRPAILRPFSQKSFIDDGAKCEFVTFKFREWGFHYSRHQCRHIRGHIVAALNKRLRDKLVFIFGAEEVKGFLELEPSAVDVKVLAI